MSQVFSLLKLGKPVPEATIHAIEGYRDQLNALQAKLDAEGKPYEVRFKNDCYILEKLTHEEAVESDIQALQKYAEQPQIFAGTKYERVRSALDRERDKLAAKGIVAPRRNNES